MKPRLLRSSRLADIAFASVALLLTQLCLPDQWASAATSMVGSPLATRCAVGDSPVGVDMMSKRYLTRRQLKTETAGMSDAQILTFMMKNHVKMMCRSKAKAMGGKETEQ
jgi:hypothetical protein